MNPKIARRTISPGESLPFEFSIDSSRTWECEMTVQSERGGADLVTPRSIPRQECNRFAGYLADVETNQLEPGMYFLVGRLSNDAQQHRELATRFTVREAM